MSSYVALILFGTAVLTYGIRVLPFLFSSLRRVPEALRRILTVMPVAALGALLFPGSLQAFPGEPDAGMAALLTAALIALCLRGSLILPVLGSITAAWFMLSL